MRTYNAIDMKGRLYDHNLEVKEFDNGEAITGTITLEVDAKGTQVEISMFARPYYNNGKVNRTYDTLAQILDGEYHTVSHDDEAADWLAVTGNIDVSYFPARNGGGDEEYGLARSMKIRGRFINDNRKKEYRNRWTMDLLITKVDEVEADEERNRPRTAKVHGYYIDDYNKRVNEVMFDVLKPAAIDYLLGLPASYDSPYFCSCWGERQVQKRVSVKKDVFGSDDVREFENKIWVLTSMSPDPYEFGDENAVSVKAYNELRDGLKKHKEEQSSKGDADEDDNLAF